MWFIDLLKKSQCIGNNQFFFIHLKKSRFIENNCFFWIHLKKSRFIENNCNFWIGFKKSQFIDLLKKSQFIDNKLRLWLWRHHLSAGPEQKSQFIDLLKKVAKGAKIVKGAKGAIYAVPNSKVDNFIHFDCRSQCMNVFLFRLWRQQNKWVMTLLYFVGYQELPDFQLQIRPDPLKKCQSCQLRIIVI